MSEQNERKGSDRIQINNNLTAICIGILAILISLSGTQLSDWVLAQLACAIPCLVLSSLAYAKTCYRPNEERLTWDRLGWLGHSLGFIMIYNSMTLLFYTSGYTEVAWVFICVISTSFIVYSIIDVTQQRRRWVEKAWKLGFYAFLLAVGSAVPMAGGLL